MATLIGTPYLAWMRWAAEYQSSFYWKIEQRLVGSLGTEVEQAFSVNALATATATNAFLCVAKAENMAPNPIISLQRKSPRPSGGGIKPRANRLCAPALPVKQDKLRHQQYQERVKQQIKPTTTMSRKEFTRYALLRCTFSPQVSRKRTLRREKSLPLCLTARSHAPVVASCSCIHVSTVYMHPMRPELNDAAVLSRGAGKRREERRVE